MLAKVHVLLHQNQRRWFDHCKASGTYLSPISYKYGINLNTETPTSEAIATAVEELSANEFYKENIVKLHHEMMEYNALERCTNYVAALLSGVKA